jgi:hypothetical protein
MATKSKFRCRRIAVLLDTPPPSDLKLTCTGLAKPDICARGDGVLCFSILGLKLR